jgi:hypothetical protein
MLYAGDRSMITGIAALWRHGIRRPVSDTVDVLVPALRKVQSVGFARLWRTSRMPDRPWTVGGIRFAPAPRAVADAALTLTASGEVRAIVADAVQRNRCTISELTAELSRCPVRGSARFRQALAEVASGHPFGGRGRPAEPAAARPDSGPVFHRTHEPKRGAGASGRARSAP